MSEKYKRIAFDMLIETVGKDFVAKHANDISFSYSETESKIDVTFLLSEPHQSSSFKKGFLNLNDEKAFERYFSLSISKNTEKCSNIVNKMLP